MPTKKQLHDRWYHEFMYGKDIYADRPNIRGSAYIGRSKGYYDIMQEDIQREDRWRSVVKKLKQDTFRYS